jgi:hypothetical protein
MGSTAPSGTRWRVYLRPSSADSDLVADASSTMNRYLPTIGFDDIANSTRFHCHTKVARRYRSGRILLAGDAARAAADKAVSENVGSVDLGIIRSELYPRFVEDRDIHAVLTHKVIAEIVDRRVEHLIFWKISNFFEHLGLSIFGNGKPLRVREQIILGNTAHYN